MVILDMEMPVACNRCKLCKSVEANEATWESAYRCVVTNTNVNSACKRWERYPDCPIVQEVEIWNSTHGKVIAPKGAFVSILNDNEDESEEN